MSAMQARRLALAGQHSMAADADHVLGEVLASAHAAIRESIRRLDTIAEEIDRAATERCRSRSPGSVTRRQIK